MVRLSILVCTTKSRDKVFAPLHRELLRQMKNKPVELIINRHETDSVGKKRQQLLEQAQGTYIVAVDSDDLIHRNYVTLILKAIESNPDCIGINGIITTNGKNKKQWFISKEYGTWFEQDQIYYRTPNHISPVRREIALKVGFPDIRHGEDAFYSEGILRYLKTEALIHQPLYVYQYRTHNK